MKQGGNAEELMSDSIMQGAAVGNVSQKGVATLVAGTITVTGVRLTASSRIQVTHNTVAGTQGIASAPAASRNVSAGSFVINSSNAADVSSVDWEING